MTRNLEIERVPEGIRIRNLVRLHEAQERARAVLVMQRIANILDTRDASRAAWSASELAWFRAPLSSQDNTFPGR